MPYLNVKTNIEIHGSTVSKLLKELSMLMSESLGKPEQYVMVKMDVAQNMIFAGKDDPTAYVELASIGLEDDDCPLLSKTICGYLQAKLKIEPSRIYIEFKSLKRRYFGWNSKTFS